MYDNSENDKKLQCSSEFGLYRCDDSDTESYIIKKKRKGFTFGYFVALLTTVVVLLFIFLVVYNYLSDRKLQTPQEVNDNFTNFNIEINNTLIPFLNITYSKEFSRENLKNDTEITNSPEESIPEPLEYRKIFINRRKMENSPRPFLYEFRDPKPTGFHSPNKQSTNLNNENQIPQNRIKNRGTVKNIQDIINLLTQVDLEPEDSSKRHKINKNKRYRTMPQQKRKTNPRIPTDPFFPFKPQNPSDVNLLAVNSFRFAPSIQVENIKKGVTTEMYPKYERPLLTAPDTYNAYNQNQPISVTLDLTQNRLLKNKPPLYNNNHLYNNLYNNNNNLYNQNQYFGNQPTRFGFNRQQQYYKPWNMNLIPNNHKRNNYMNQNINKEVPNPMIVQLNLYPKKKSKKPQEDSDTEESSLHSNCNNNDLNEDYEDNDPQIKNATEFSQLIKHIRFSQGEPVKPLQDENNLFRIKNTLLQLDKPAESNNYDNTKNSDIDVQKSIGFTIVNPNFSETQPSSNDDYYTNTASHWNPEISNERDDKLINIETENHGLEVGEVNENFDETSTLPIPPDIFQKYFNTKPTPKYNTPNDWDPEIIQQNPNLINHRASFQEDRNE